MTAGEIDQILSGDSSGKDHPNRRPCDCRIRLSGDKFKKLEVCNKLMSLAEQYGFHYTFSARLEKELAIRTPSLAAPGDTTH